MGDLSTPSQTAAAAFQWTPSSFAQSLFCVSQQGIEHVVITPGSLYSLGINAAEAQNSVSPGRWNQRCSSRKKESIINEAVMSYDPSAVTRLCMEWNYSDHERWVWGRRSGAGLCNGGVTCDCSRGEIERTLRRPSQEYINKSFSQTSQGNSTKPALLQ